MFKLSFRQQVLIGFAFSILLVFLVGFLSFRSIRQLEKNSADIEVSQHLIQNTSQILQLLVDAETGMRGYVATGKPTYLDPYNAALMHIGQSQAALNSFELNDPLQGRDINLLHTLIARQLENLKTSIRTRDAVGLDYIIKQNLLLNGKQDMDSIRATVARINNREQSLVNQRRGVTENAVQVTIVTIVGGSCVFFIIILFMLYFIQGTFKKQQLIEEEIKQSNTELEKVLSENEAKNWLLTGAGLLNERMQGQQKQKELTENILAEVCRYANAISGTLYTYDEQSEKLELSAWYAYHDLSLIRQSLRVSEGWMGQVAKDRKAVSIKGKLNDKLYLQTSIINQDLSETYIVPLIFNQALMGVIEVAFQHELKHDVKDYLQLVAKDIGSAIHTAQARTIMQNLFEETQQQAEELEAQQEEMRVTNEELMSKTEMLQASEEELRVQQEELRTINVQLTEKASLMEEKNQAIEEARKEIMLKVEELETTGRYKSEFLANMSHELRTPLNSILVLARILKDNKAENLSTEQIKYASVIFNAGNDLLTLINDILDLAKIESGKLELQNERTSVAEIIDDMHMLFAEVASNKHITYQTNTENAPEFIVSDKIRIEQVLKNLLSNAFKFTPENGNITISATYGDKPGTISFLVKDSGIGIKPEKQKLIFEAFQQEDGSTSRKYGGTGLGLSISKELAALLGGSITLKSQSGQGSEFTLTLPLEATQLDIASEEVMPTVQSFVPTEKMPELPKIISTEPGRQPLVVIVEDDRNFSEILENYANEHGYKSVLVNEGTNAVEIITTNKPDAVILDIMLPGKDGWQILKELKRNPETKNIPVHLMSAGEAADKRVKSEGAISFMKKPINTEALDKLFGNIIHQSGTAIKQILLIEDHEAQSDAIKELMLKQGITVEQAFTGEDAYQKMLNNEYQCVVLDLNLPDISGLDLLDKIKSIERFASLPIIINTAMELDKNSVSRLMQYANAMVVKTSKSSDRLIDEVNLFLHKLNTKAPVAPTAKPKGKFVGMDSLKGKKVLLVDDDMRNIFALSSALQSYDLHVEIANDGQEALDKLNELTDGVDIVLMDIMMPRMDGYEAMKLIRQQNKWAKLPVIALTAKAMKDDREKCIAAGANDYITKPVDVDRLISLMQLWMDN